MDRGRPADRINRLPFEKWLRAEEGALYIGVEQPEAARLLRAGRRNGMITVRRDADSVLFMRIRRRPAAGVRREGTPT